MGRRMRMPGHGWSHDRDTIREMADACARRSAALLCGSAFLSSGNGNARAAEPQRFVVSIKSRKVEPATTAVLRLDATIAGRFPIEAHGFASGRSGHGGHVVLLYLEVHPR